MINQPFMGAYFIYNRPLSYYSDTLDSLTIERAKMLSQSFYNEYCYADDERFYLVRSPWRQIIYKKESIDGSIEWYCGNSSASIVTTQDVYQNTFYNIQKNESLKQAIIFKKMSEQPLLHGKLKRFNLKDFSAC